MNKYILLAAAACAMLSLESCFKDEPLNAECDIETMTLRTASPEDVFFQLSDTMRMIPFSDSTIIVDVKPRADLTAITPVFKITEGATISPASGVPQDFSKGSVVYTVTSQDGQWSRHYTVALNPLHIYSVDTLKYDFECYELEPKGKYYVWYNMLDGVTPSYDWASGNAGFQLSMGSAKPADYPSTPARGEGPDGSDCLKLITRSTGSFGVMVNKRIAAGNFFFGEFDISIALKDAMKATRFGKPFSYKPTKFTGYYKYTPGDKFQDKMGKEVAGMVDNGSIYAVFYRNHDAQGNPVILFGDDVQTNPNIVAIAKVKDVHATNEWTPWEIDFDYLGEVDEELLKNMGYNFTIVFSSSVYGDVFEGAVGSTLMIDKVRVVCQQEQ